MLRSSSLRLGSLRLGLAATLLLSSLPAHALHGSDTKGSDWPQWRGPERTGVSEEATWSATGSETPLWTKDLGYGHSSFAIAEGRVYTLGYDVEQGLDRVYCFDLESGDEVWRHEYASEIWNTAHDGGTTTTPTVLGDAVYTSNREGKVFRFDRESGDVVWTRDLRADLELEPPTWGFSASPLVVDGHVIMNIDRVVALDAETGEQVWASEKNYGKAYSTPTPFENGGRELLAVLSGSGLAVLERGNGSEVAFYGWSKDPEIYPMSPVVIGDRIFISAGYNRGATMLKLEGTGLTELWSSRVMRNKMSGAVLFDGHLFGFDESILKCIDLDGKERWRARGMGTGSMSIAGGRLVILDGRGQIIVAEANPEEYVELSRQSVLSDGTAWATPVLSHGRVFCRSSLGEMACLDYRSAGKSSSGFFSTTEIPAAEKLVARHVERLGGPNMLANLAGVRLNGKSESLINTVRSGSVELRWSMRHGSRWIDEAGIDFGYDTEIGWRIQPRSNPTVLRDADLVDLRRGCDLAQLFDPARGFSDLTTKRTTTFEGARCYEVEAKSEDGRRFTLYFDMLTGLFAGQQGEGSSMWVLGDYRASGPTLLPWQWSIYEPDKGERITAQFERADVMASFEDGDFVPPEALKPFMRSPEEIARDNAHLAKVHAGWIGEWKPDDDPEASTSTFQVDEGFLMVLRENRPPSYLSPAREDGSVVMIGAEYVSFHPEKDENGEITAITVRVGPDPRARYVRVEP